MPNGASKSEVTLWIVDFLKRHGPNYHLQLSSLDLTAAAVVHSAPGVRKVASDIALQSEHPGVASLMKLVSILIPSAVIDSLTVTRTDAHWTTPPMINYKADNHHVQMRRHTDHEGSIRVCDDDPSVVKAKC